MKGVFFPVFLDISEKNILVVGGGEIATRRVHTLLEFSSNIVVVAPKISKELAELENERKIIWESHKYSKNYLCDKDIVIAATNDTNVNSKVKRDCEEEKNISGRFILANIADDKNLCDFYFPSVVKKENVIVGINSSGKSPKMTKQIRKEIENLLSSDTIYEMDV